jgi:hypothetical protein
MSLVPVCCKIYNVLSHSEVKEIAWAADSPCGSQYIVSVAPLLRTARRLDSATQHSIHVAFPSFIPTLGSRQAMVLEDTKTENCKAFSHLSSWRWRWVIGDYFLSYRKTSRWGQKIDEFFSESRDGSKFRCGICPIRALSRFALCEDKDGRPFVECARRCRLTEDCRQVYDVGRRSAEEREWTEERVWPYPCRHGSPNVREKCMNMWSLRCLKPE